MKNRIPAATALRQALRPMREQAERMAAQHGGGCLISTTAIPGHTVEVQVVRRSRPVCGVPAPYAYCQIWWHSWPAGQDKPGNGQAGFSGSGTDLGSFVSRFRMTLAREQAQGQDQ